MNIKGLGDSSGTSNRFVQMSASDGVLRLAAGESTDWFEDPSGEYHAASSPVLWFRTDLPSFAFGATVAVNLKETFDAAGLTIRSGDDWWGKLAFERSPAGRPTIVTVVSNPVSDDANGPETGDGPVALRIVRKASTVSMHWRQAGGPWQLARYCRLPAAASIEVGLTVQSPTGPGLEATFSSCFLNPSVPADIRSGD